MKNFNVILLMLTLMSGAVNAMASESSDNDASFEQVRNGTPATVLPDCGKIKVKVEQDACYSKQIQQQKEKFAIGQRNETQTRNLTMQKRKQTQTGILLNQVHRVGGSVCGDGTDIGMGALGWFYVWCCSTASCSGSWLFD